MGINSWCKGRAEGGAVFPRVCDMYCLRALQRVLVAHEKTSWVVAGGEGERPTLKSSVSLSDTITFLANPFQSS